MDNGENKKKFTELSEKLVALSESKEEFDFWLKIFDDLDTPKQNELIVQMESELQKLESLA